MTEEKQDSRKIAGDLDIEIEKKLGIETVSFKCNKELLDKLTSLAAAADMDVEPFIRRLCTEFTSQSQASKEIPSAPKSLSGVT